MNPLMIAELASAGIGGLQALVNALPTKQSRHNKQQLEELLKREQQGTLGLSGAEKQQLSSAAMTPVREMADEARKRQEAATATMGQSSAADLLRIRGAEQEAVAKAGEQAGRSIAEADIAKAGQQRNEIEQRLGTQAARRTDVVEGLGKAAGDAAKVEGAKAGAVPYKLWGMYGEPMADTNAFRTTATKLGFDPEEIDQLIKMEEQNPGFLAEMVRELQAGG